MNQGQGAPSFAYGVPSIHQKRPAIPLALGNLDLNRQVTAGDPLDYQRVIHAKSVAEVLKGLRDVGDPQVTQEMVTISASRAVAVDGAYAASVFSPQNIAQALQQMTQHLANVDNTLINVENRLANIDNRFGNVENNVNNRFGNVDNRLGNIDDRLGNIHNRLDDGLVAVDDQLRDLTNEVRVVRAQSANLRITSRNKFGGQEDLEPLQKTVAGYGRTVALPFVAAMDQNGRQNFNIQHPQGGNASLVGSTPPNFSPNLEGYRHLDICKLIVFYNEDFGIDPQDDLPTRIRRFRRFLSEF